MLGIEYPYVPSGTTSLIHFLRYLRVISNTSAIVIWYVPQTPLSLIGLWRELVWPKVEEIGKPIWNWQREKSWLKLWFEILFFCIFRYLENDREWYLYWSSLIVHWVLWFVNVFDKLMTDVRWDCYFEVVKYWSYLGMFWPILECSFVSSTFTGKKFSVCTILYNNVNACLIRQIRDTNLEIKFRICLSHVWLG